MVVVAGSPGICATLIARLVVLVIVVAHSTTTEHAERSIEAVLARVHTRAIPAHADGARGLEVWALLDVDRGV